MLVLLQQSLCEFYLAIIQQLPPVSLAVTNAMEDDFFEGLFCFGTLVLSLDPTKQLCFVALASFALVGLLWLPWVLWPFDLWLLCPCTISQYFVHEAFAA